MPKRTPYAFSLRRRSRPNPRASRRCEEAPERGRSPPVSVVWRAPKTPTQRRCCVMDAQNRVTLVREKIGNGSLPPTPWVTLWGGPGTRAACAACERPIVPPALEFECHAEGGPSALGRASAPPRRPLALGYGSATDADPGGARPRR